MFNRRTHCYYIKAMKQAYRRETKNSKKEFNQSKRSTIEKNLR